MTEAGEGGGGNKPPDTGGGEKKILLYNEQAEYDNYRVVVQSRRASDNSIPFISNQKVGMMIHDTVSEKKDVYHVVRLNRSKLLVTCSSAKTANEIVKAEKIRHCYDPFIPYNYVNRVGIIRDIDEEFDDEQLREAVDAKQFKVVSVQRLNRRVVDDQNVVKYVKSRSVKIVFEGKEIPSHVYLYYCRIECEPFIQKVVQCFKCAKFGHTTKFCRNHSLCKQCFVVLENNHVCSESNQVKCVNCGGLHKPRDDSCPELARQKNIKMLMSTRCMLFQEADKVVPANKSTYSVRVNNSFSVLNELSHFPGIDDGCGSSQDTQIRKYVDPPLPYKSSVNQRTKVFKSTAIQKNLVNARRYNILKMLCRRMLVRSKGNHHQISLPQ
uniref:CCHC-type domain-containing protein n=1 Tax=Cacopsylla melanoneura TaxID=428564 RepID=A0A8D8YRA4_9HEMI